MNSNNESKQSSLNLKNVIPNQTYFRIEANPIKKVDTKLKEILFITSYPPRECGIATYSQDLIRALENQFNNSFKSTICALESDSEKHIYKEQPKFILNTNDSASYLNNAFKINNDVNIQLVVIQHEFGFYAQREDDFKTFFKVILKPIVFVFHTVLPKPRAEMSLLVNEMEKAASSIVVMTKHAKTILNTDYGIALSKIIVIPHGTHLVPSKDKHKIKKQYGLSNRKVLSTFGLLSESKSIETTIKALPEIAKFHPEVLFLILGKTHPNIVKQEGELYREKLEKIARDLNIQKHLRFVNEYLQLDVLLDYLQLTDIYLFTSKDPNQAVSGTFSYAVSCGCPVISTPIPHSLEVIGQSNGVIIDFENSEQLSKAAIALLDNEKRRAEISSNSLHKMASTAWQNSAISHALLFKKLSSDSFQLAFSIPKLNFDHILKMTTEFGLIQFSKLSNPDIHSGYTLDDNARALIALCQHYKMHKNEKDLSLINTYFRFINHCYEPNSKFLNYVGHHKEFTHQNFSENLEDSNGRAIWALGYLCSLKGLLPLDLTEKAETLLDSVLPHLVEIHSTRAMAFIIKGLCYQQNDKNAKLMVTLANRMVQMYKHEKNHDWFWFEDYMTYGNSLLSEAMLDAYVLTKNVEYKKIAKESFDFLMTKIIIDNTIKVVSNKGWYFKNTASKSPIGGEQPIDVAYTVIALEKFYTVFNEDQYKQKAIVAFNWFLGQNHLKQIVYNPCTGGSYDGVEEFNVNLNQGAESTISYLLARLSIERILRTPGETIVKGNAEFAKHIC